MNIMGLILKPFLQNVCDSLIDTPWVLSGLNHTMQHIYSPVLHPEILPNTFLKCTILLLFNIWYHMLQQGNVFKFGMWMPPEHLALSDIH